MSCVSAAAWAPFVDCAGVRDVPQHTQRDCMDHSY